MTAPHLFARKHLLAAAHLLAPKLLGAVIESDTGLGLVSGRIVEVEAYDETDAASHSFRGITKRTVPMFGPAGHAYIYRSYGIHLCLNIVCGEEGFGAAVLVRALEPLRGIDVMQKLRRINTPHAKLCAGPGNVAQALNLTLSQSGSCMVDGGSTLRLLRGRPVAARNIIRSRRIGISVAQEILWRFFVAGCPYVSATRRV